MAGPAIRAWHIATALAGEHDVQLVTTTRLCEVSSPSFRVRSVNQDELRSVEAWTDVMVVQGYVLVDNPFLRSSPKVMVVDLYDPMHLESLELTRGEEDSQRQIATRSVTAIMNDQLGRGDFFMCASVKQRDFWLGHLTALGRVNPLTYDDDETFHSLISVVPFGLPDNPPVSSGRVLRGVLPGIEDEDDVLLWGGGIYNWFDPITLIEAVDRLRRSRPQVRLFFLGLTHPNPDVPKMRMVGAARARAEELGLTGRHVFFNDGWVPYEDRQSYLLEADVGVSTHLQHLETAFSFRTRILDYMWAQLPIVASEGDAFADLIQSERLGITVPVGDLSALESALLRILADPDLAATCRANLERVARDYTWSKVLVPLVEFCRSPRRAPDLVDPQISRDLEARSRHRPAAATSWRRDLETAGTHLRVGGLPLLLTRARGRVDRMLAGLRERS